MVAIRFTAPALARRANSLRLSSSVRDERFMVSPVTESRSSSNFTKAQRGRSYEAGIIEVSCKVLKPQSLPNTVECVGFGLCNKQVSVIESSLVQYRTNYYQQQYHRQIKKIIPSSGRLHTFGNRI
jgi:proline dehydrogenase